MPVLTGNLTVDVFNINTALGAPAASGVDDTLVLQALIDANRGGTVRLPRGLYVVTSLTLPTITIEGEQGAIIQQRAGTNAHMLVTTAVSAVVTLRNLTLDGNWQNSTNDDTHEYVTARFSSVGTATAPAGFTADNVTFLNGRNFDIWASPNGGDTASSYVNVRNSRFFKGIEGTTTFSAGCVLLQGTPISSFVNNTFDLLATPVAAGRSGITQQEGTTPVANGRFTVTGNNFRNIGRSDASGVLGNIDVYQNGQDAIVTSNRLTQPYGRGIDVKGDIVNGVIGGNIIDGLNMVTGYGSPEMQAQITVNPSKDTTVGKTLSVSGNVLSNSGKDAIYVSAVETGLVNTLRSVSFDGNVISSPAECGYHIRYAADIAITGGNIYGAQIGVWIETVFTGTARISTRITDTFIPGANPLTRAGTGIYDTAGSGSFVHYAGCQFADIAFRGINKSGVGGGFITGCQFVRTANYAIAAATTALTLILNNDLASTVTSTPTVNYTSGAVFASGNRSANGVRVLDNTRTVASNVLIAPWDVVYVDTAGAAQSVYSINNVPDGFQVTVMINSASNSLTLSQGAGTNLELPGGTNIVLTALGHMVTLQYFAQVAKFRLVSKNF